MKKEYLLEVSRIKEIMGLIVEGRPLVSKYFDFNNIIRRKIADDDAAKAYNFQSGNRKLESLYDIENELDYIFRKEFDDIAPEELTFLKDFNSKLLRVDDIEAIASGLKNDFLTIAGDDLAKGKFFNEMNKVLDSDQFDIFKSEVSPNQYQTFSKDTLKKIWAEEQQKLLKKTPTADDIKLLDTLFEGGIITKEDYTKAMRSAPGFSDAWKLYSSYVEFSKKTPDVTFEKYLEMELQKDPKFAGKAGIIAKRISGPLMDFGKGMYGDKKLMSKGAKGLLTQTAFLASLGLTWQILKLIFLAGETGSELIEKGVKFLSDYKGVSDEDIKDRWTKYWSYDNPQIVVNGKTMSIYEGGSNSDITKGNPPQYTRLGKTNNLKLLNPLDIGGTSTNVIEFKLSTAPIVAGMESFSPDVITLPSSQTTTNPQTQTTDTYENTLEGFKKWVLAQKLQGTPTVDSTIGGFLLNGVNYQITSDKKGFE
jgi:hypothetical protein